MKLQNVICKGTLFILILIVAGCSKSPTSNLKELGFYNVISGKTQYQSFKEYGDGSTERSLPVSDFPSIPVLKQGDYFLVYGDIPGGAMGTGLHVFSYELDGSSYESKGTQLSLESFFSREPLESIQGNKLTKLSPRASTENGIYFLHRYVGMEGDAYLAFKIER